MDVIVDTKLNDDALEDNDGAILICIFYLYKRKVSADNSRNLHDSKDLRPRIRIAFFPHLSICNLVIVLHLFMVVYRYFSLRF